MQNKNNRGFSLIELVVVVAIIAALSGAAYLGMQGAKRSSMNNKMLTDLVAIANALDQYRRDHNNSYPIPEAGSNMNVNCYYADATYAHDCSEEGDYSFIQGMIDSSLLGVKYLQEVPTDPRTGSRYAYGVSRDGKYFQVAGVWDDGTSYEARTADNIAKGFHLPSLIRSYDSPNFVVDKGEYLPYSPDHLVLTARLQRFEGVTITSNEEAITDPDKIKDFVLNTGDAVETSDTGFCDIYYSDGSVSHLEAGSRLELSELSIAQNDSKNIISRIKVLLGKGKIWNKVVRLASDSEFNIETSGAIAGVRGTQFKVEDTGTITVLSGKVVVLDKNNLDHQLAEISDNGADIILSRPKVAVISGDSVSITEGDSSVKQDYDAAFPKYLDNTIAPGLVKADAEILTIEMVDYQVDKIFSTLDADNPLEFSRDEDFFYVTYEQSQEPQSFYFGDALGNLSALSIQTTLHELSGEISFEGISGSLVRSKKARWSLSEPPARLVIGGNQDSFSLAASVLNKNSLLGADQLMAYKLAIVTPAICKNTAMDFFNNFSFDGVFEIEALGKGDCIYWIEAGVPDNDSWPESFNVSFGMSSSVKVPIEERQVEDLYADFEISTEPCDSSNEAGVQDNASVAIFGDQTFYLCGPAIIGEPEDIRYYWNTSHGLIADEESQNTTLIFPRDEIISDGGTNLVVGLQVYRNEEEGSDSYDENKMTVHMVLPTVTSVSLTVVGSNIVRQNESLELKAEVSDIAFNDLTDEEKNITENCIWEISGASSWNATPNKEIIAVPEDAQSGDYTLTCTIPYLVNFDLAEAPLVATTNFKIPEPEDPFLVACVGADGEDRTGDETNGYTNSGKNTYYTPSGECWALGNATASVGESCTITCSNIGLNCVDGSWNDENGAICSTLTGGEIVDQDTGERYFVYADYAPVWYENAGSEANQCKQRSDNGRGSGDISSCSDTTENEYNKRICKCISQ